MILEIKKIIYEVLLAHLPREEKYEYLIEIPQNTNFGDLSTNVLMIYGKKVVNKNLFQEDLVKKFRNLYYIDDINVVGAGFINFFLKPIVLENISYEYIKNIGKNENISIEYASPNPTGPSHLGHARGSIIGEILVNLYKYLGYNVRKDCIFNDGGNQINSFIKSIFINYQIIKDLNNQLSFEDGEEIVYKGDYVKDLAKNIFIKDQKSSSLEEFKEKYQSEILEEMKKKMIEDLSLLGIKHDLITYESRLGEEKDICWRLLKEKNLIISEKTDKGIKLLFNSTFFSDDKDRVIEREDGSVTYFGNDIAYHLRKKNTPFNNSNEKEFNRQIIVLGDDHVGYLRRLSNAVGNFNINLQIVTHNLVKIFKNNQEIKMSKRAGNFITIRDFLKNHSRNLLKILMIGVGYNSVINIDLNHLIDENHLLNNIQNTINFLESIFIYYKRINIQDFNQIFQEEINKDFKRLISYIVYWEEFVIKCCKNLEVHLLLLYLDNICKVLINIKNNNFSLKFNNLEIFILHKTYDLISNINSILMIDI
jgi:arginyl-tRNA synthetase